MRRAEQEVACAGGLGEDDDMDESNHEEDGVLDEVAQRRQLASVCCALRLHRKLSCHRCTGVICSSIKHRNEMDSGQNMHAGLQWNQFLLSFTPISFWGPRAACYLLPELER